MRLTATLLTLLIAVCFAGCSNYHHISLTGSDLYKKKRIKENIEAYDVILHSGDERVVLAEPEISETTLTGTVSEVHIEIETEATEPEGRTVPEDEQNDLHIFLENGQEIIIDSLPQEIQITEEQIESISVLGKEQHGAAGDIGEAILTVLAVIVLLLLILILAALGSSDPDLNGSGSGSNSGGSGSDSGGSGGSNVGCYVATMSYGSYDAPQVMILRNFRDRFLQNYGWGRSFISWYYANSPGFVEKHRSRIWLHKTLRVGLDVLVAMLRPFYS